MQITTGDENGFLWVECAANGGPLSTEADALELLAACGEAGTACLLLAEGSLDENFTNLRSGLAGQVLLKFSNYRIKAAAVIPAEIAGQGRFGEFVLETNRGQAFRIYPTREMALAWLKTTA